MQEATIPTIPVSRYASSMRFRWLLHKSKKITMTSEERDAQMKSFAYGNTKIDNDFVTRKMVEEVFTRMRENGQI